jgi:hypothetical protein
VDDLRRELAAVLVAGAAHADAARAAALRHEGLDDAVEGQTVVEAEQREPNGACHVIRGDVVAEAEGHVADRRFEFPQDLAAAVERRLREHRKAFAPTGRLGVDLRLGDGGFDRGNG